MIRRKGELSPAGIDRGWPHQVALRASACEGGGYKAIHDFCKDLSLCPRGHSVIYEGAWFHVYCFAEPDHAEKFMERFRGEKFDPSERGRGANWAQWRKR
jgi:hypothetical protein